MAPSKHTNGRQVALLRGINVGGKNKLSMKELVKVFQELGCTDIQTYIQSGNVVFSAAKLIALDLQPQASILLKNKYKIDVPVVIRTAEEFIDAFENNPFHKPRTDIETLHVAFLAAKPTMAAIETLDPIHSLPDRFIVSGCEIYLHCPNGLAKTKLTNKYFDSKLETTSTMRNWKTMMKLREMLKD